MSKQLKHTFDFLLYSYIRSKYIVDDRLAKSLSSNADPRWLCKGGGNLITKYDRHNNLPFLATQMNIPFKMDSKGNVKQSCKLCEYIINQLNIDSYLKHWRIQTTKK